MTVTDLDKGKIKITLMDKEILALFGTYGRFYSMDENVKPIFERILEKVLFSRGLSLKEELIIKVKVKANCGCTILISPVLKQPTEHIFVFRNTEKLLDGVLFLKRCKAKIIKSELYKTSIGYALIIYSMDDSPFLLTLKEYCLPYTPPPFYSEHLKEYGKQIIAENATAILSKYFFKEI